MTSPLKSKVRFRTRALLLPLALAGSLSACDRPEPPPDPSADVTAVVPDAAMTPPDPNDMSSASGADPAVDPTMAGTSPSGQTVAGAGAPGQDEALALLAAINEHEMAAAEQARSKGVDGEELAFADLMYREHSKNLAETQALAPGAPDSSVQVAQQRAKGKAELDRLAGLEGNAYEEAYIDAMVTGHDEALKLLDTRVLPAAQDDAVKRHLTTTREHVAAHLEKARALQGD
jgi:putative membrane protein